MKLSGHFIVRSIATSLLMVAILLMGVLAYRLLPVSALPDVDYPTMQVVTFYPGASPDVVATSITAPLEKQLGQMPGLDQMTSTSSYGASVITLQFVMDLSLDIAEQEVQEAINGASSYLPQGLPNPPVYKKVNPADAPILTLGLVSKNLPITTIEDYAETRLAQHIAQQSGVGLVAISGGQRPAVRIQANPLALASYGLSLEAIRSAIASANVNAAKGSLNGPDLAYTLNANDQLLSAGDYRSLVVAYHNGAPVRLQDVANVIDGAENNQLAAWVNRQPGVVMTIQRQPGANVIQVVDRIQAMLANLKSTLPADLNVSVLSDRTITIRASVADVQMELLLSIVLVVCVIFVFLRHALATIIPSVSVPLSLIGTFGVMYLLGYSLNNITLMALTIATGFVVDDAIVMIENIARYVEHGYKPFEAAIKGAEQIGFTIITLTISLIAVMIPLFFMTSIVGLLFRQFAVTLSVAILISAFISLTLTPMLCSRLLKHHEEHELSKFSQKTGIFFNKVIEKYSVSLRFALNHQNLILFISFLIFIVTATLFYIIPKGFFPTQDTGTLQGISIATQSTSFANMAVKQQALANIVLNDPDVASVASFIGIDGTNTTLNSGRMLITLKPLNQRSAASVVMQRLHQHLSAVPGATLYLQPVQDLTLDSKQSPTEYQLTVSAPKLADVDHWTAILLSQLRNLPELSDVVSDQQDKGLQTVINMDRDQAARFGISMQTLDNTLYDAFGQRQISTMYTDKNQYHVILEVLPSLQLDPYALNQVYIPSSVVNLTNNVYPNALSSLSYMNATNQTTTATGATPISTFIQVSTQLGPLLVNRLNQFPVSTISFNLAPNAALGSAINAINAIQQKLNIPQNVQVAFQGTAKVFADSLNNEAWLVLAAIIVVYILLGVLYESYIHPLTILSTLPSAGMGALFALYLTRHALTVIALIGIILLIGIVMKNAIMMIDFALEQERTYKKTPLDAIYEAAILRFRPILMTTMAAMLGAVPLALGTGMGSELRNPLGITIIGGLIVSQLLTLYTTPVVYLTFDKILRRILAIGEHHQPESQGEG